MKYKLLVSLLLAIIICSQSVVSADCDPSCATCDEKSATTCLTCNPDDPDHSKLQDGKCIVKCSDGKFDKSSVCQDCDSNCKTCQNALDNCTSCGDVLTKFYDNKCYDKCPEKTFGDSNDCKQCDSSCLTCSAASDSSCLTCPTTGTPKQYNNKCLVECPTKTFQLDSKCTDCKSTCASCQNATECISCDSGTPKLYNKECVVECPTKTFQLDSKCTDCKSTCASCQNATECTSCDSGTPKLYKKECLESCPASTFDDSNNCTDCDASCATCSGTGSNNCKTCPQTKLLYKNQCHDKCPEKTFKDGTSCTDCDASCGTCKGSTSNDCLTCNDPNQNVKQDGSCGCKQGTYSNKDSGNCENCNAKCLTCSGPDSNMCLKCQENMNFHEGECVQKCPNGTFSNQKHMCEKCNSDCLTCNGKEANNCLSCNSDIAQKSKLNEGTCIANCPSNKFDNNNNCQACDSTCLTCSGASSKDCLSCDLNNKANDSLWKNECLDKCPINAFFDDGKKVCKECNPNCKTCTGPSSNTCLSCDSNNKNHEIYNPDKKQCVKQCPKKMFNKEGVCEDCHTTCETCSGPGEKECLTCPKKDKAQLVDGECKVSGCPVGTYQDQELCKDCDASCESCSGSLNSNCLSCKKKSDVSKLYNGTCVGKCPESQVFEKKNVCYDCPSDLKKLNKKALAEALKNCSIALDTDQKVDEVVDQIDSIYADVKKKRKQKDKDQEAQLSESEEVVNSSREVLLKLKGKKNFSKKNQDFSLFKGQIEKGAKPIKVDSGVENGASVSVKIPDTAFSEISNAEFLSACFYDDLFTQSTDQFKAPACDFSIKSGESESVSTISNLSSPIIIDFTPSGGVSSPVKAKYWSEEEEAWKEDGVQTKLENGQIQVSTTHLTTFQLVPDDSGVVLQNDTTFEVVLSVVMVVGCLLFATLALCIDYKCFCKKENPTHYPHRSNQNLDSSLFISVLKHSMFYNFPITMPFSFQDYNLRSYARALWYTNILWITLIIMMVFLAEDVSLTSKSQISANVIGILCGLIALSNTLVYKCLAKQRSKLLSVDEHDPLLGHKIAHKTKGRYERRECGYILLKIFSVFIYFIGVALIIELSPYLAQANNKSNLVYGFIIAIVFGWFYCILKILIGACIVSKCKNSRCLNCFFVDSMTNYIEEHFANKDVPDRFNLAAV